MNERFTVQAARDAFAAIGHDPTIGRWRGTGPGGGPCACLAIALACHARGDRDSAAYVRSALMAGDTISCRVAADLDVPRPFVSGIISGWDSQGRDDTESRTIHQLIVSSVYPNDVSGYRDGYRYGALCAAALSANLVEAAPERLDPEPLKTRSHKR